MITVMPNKAVPMVCWLGGKRVATMVSAVGINAPPARPWPTRPMIIMVSEVDSPQTTEKAVNITAQISRKLRRPSVRTNQPVSGIMMISATR